MAEVPDVSPGARASEASASPATSTSSTISHSAGTPRSATGSRDTSAVAAASSPNAGDPPITPTPSVTVPALQQILAVLAAGTAVATDPAVTVAQVTARLAPGGTTLSTRVARLRPILPKPTLHGHKVRISSRRPFPLCLFRFCGSHVRFTLSESLCTILNTALKLQQLRDRKFDFRLNSVLFQIRRRRPTAYLLIAFG